MTGEELLRAGGETSLAYYRAGDPGRPLLVFVPGTGHLARIAYGHAGCDRRDFLDHWLERAGLGLLALSYPSDHPALGGADPEMTSSRWAALAVAATRMIVDRERLSSRIVLAAWSMGGKIVPGFSRAAAEQGLDVRCFVSLSATPPLMGLASITPGGEKLTAVGLWDIFAPFPDGGSFPAGWAADLAGQNRLAGHCVIPADIYRRDYLCNLPLHLRGGAARLRAGRLVDDAGEAVADLAANDFAAYPLAATIVPGSPLDALHALTDRDAWAGFSLRGVFERHVRRLAAPAQWNEIVAFFRALPNEMLREVEGGHFFFVGMPGARATAAHISELIGVAETRRVALERLIGETS